MVTFEPPRGMVDGDDPWKAVGLSRVGMNRFLRAAQESVGLEGEVDVLLSNDRTLRRLNRAYRGLDKATDVLSFPAAEDVAEMFAGDLAISIDTAKKQAAEHGHSLRDEVRVLVLHGLLHLAGMDHEVDGGEMAEREGILRRALRLRDGLIARVGGGSRFPAGMTERKAGARTGNNKSQYGGRSPAAQDDGEKQVRAKARSRFPAGMTERKTRARTKATGRKGVAA